MIKYSVQVTSHFELEFIKLSKKHTSLIVMFRQDVISVLSMDPLNKNKIYPIVKLKGVPEGQAQYRIKFDRFRFLYDVNGNVVYLKACSLRSESTYS